VADLVADLPGWAAPGAFAAILAMAVATYLCRVGGYFAMTMIPLSPRVRQGLAALPGSIVVATVLPVAERGGLVAIVALLAGLGAMLVTRREVVALVAGLGLAAALRAAGL
jgi:uncharacterized membrane protein